jgi:hypothetical protein
MEIPASAILAAISVLLCSFPALGQQQATPEQPAHCIPGGFHKDAPSLEEESLAACQSWQDNSCCTNDTAWKIEEAGYELLYNFTWSMCGDLSQECTAFMQVQCGDIKPEIRVWDLQRGKRTFTAYSSAHSKYFSLLYDQIYTSSAIRNTEIDA